MQMHEVRRLMKLTVAYVLYYSGALWLYAALRLRRRAVVLTYHRVLPESADSFSSTGITVTPETFASHMRFLRRHFHPLSAAEFLECLTRRIFPPRACLVTFDDGWFDNERYALPILAHHDVRAVLFIATGYIGTTKAFWQEELTRLLFVASRLPVAASQLLADLGIPEATAANDWEARRITRNLVTRLKSAGAPEVERIRERLLSAQWQQHSPIATTGDDVFLDWDAVTRLKASGLVTIGSHAHSHIPLPRLGREGAAIDLQMSRQVFENRGLPSPAMCAYPNGDYDTDVIEAASEAGFTVGFTTDSGHVAPGDNWRRLSRINIHESATSSPPEFLCRILGLF